MKVLLSRWQFGVTITYHFLFVPLTTGLALLVAVMQVLAYRQEGRDLGPGIRNPFMTNGVAVVTAPVDIDIITTAEQLRTVLLDAGSHGHVTVVVDMTQTRFCDCSGLSVLIRAHRRPLAEGGELQRPVAKVLALLGADQMITIRGGTEATSGSAGTQD